MIIEFCGLSGVGKTTAIDLVKKSFPHAVVINGSNAYEIPPLNSKNIFEQSFIESAPEKFKAYAVGALSRSKYAGGIVDEPCVLLDEGVFSFISYFIENRLEHGDMNSLINEFMSAPLPNLLVMLWVDPDTRYKRIISRGTACFDLNLTKEENYIKTEKNLNNQQNLKVILSRLNIDFIQLNTSADEDNILKLISEKITRLDASDSCH